MGNSFHSRQMANASAGHESTHLWGPNVAPLPFRSVPGGYQSQKLVCGFPLMYHLGGDSEAMRNSATIHPILIQTM